MQAIDLTELLIPYENKWVALTKDEEKVICSGKSAMPAAAVVSGISYFLILNIVKLF